MNKTEFGALIGRLVKPWVREVDPDLKSAFWAAVCDLELEDVKAGVEAILRSRLREHGAPAPADLRQVSESARDARTRQDQGRSYADQIRAMRVKYGLEP